MAEPEVDWRREVARLADKNHGRAVADAQQQAAGLLETPEYWEAVYTLAVQRVNMEAK